MTNFEILTHQALQSIDCKMCNQNEKNWEQRRYEIAKDLYVQTCQQARLEGDNTAADVFRSAAWLSRVAADYLIEVLKK